VLNRLPQAIFCPVETSGDGEVNFQSRVLMYLFKARRRAKGGNLNWLCNVAGLISTSLRADESIAKNARRIIPRMWSPARRPTEVCP